MIKMDKKELRKWRTYAARAGARKYLGKPWQIQIGARIWAAGNNHAKCLGGE